VAVSFRASQIMGRQSRFCVEQVAHGLFLCHYSEWCCNYDVVEDGRRALLALYSASDNWTMGEQGGLIAYQAARMARAEQTC
jgi:hypothetical protein